MVYGKQLEAEIPSLKNAFFSKTHFSYVIMNQMLFITWWLIHMYLDIISIDLLIVNYYKRVIL